MCPGLLDLWPAWKDWKQLAPHELINFAWNVTEFPLINTWKYALRISSISDSILVFSTILTEISSKSFGLVFSLFQPLLYCSNLAVYVVQFRRTGFTFSIRYSSDSWNTCDLQGRTSTHYFSLTSVTKETENATWRENPANPFSHRRQTLENTWVSCPLINICHKFSLRILWNATILRHIISIHKQARVQVK